MNDRSRTENRQRETAFTLLWLIISKNSTVQNNIGDKNIRFMILNDKNVISCHENDICGMDFIYFF